MNTTFTYAQGSLQLQRWPLNQPNSSLQAWDAADELLIQHTFEAAEQFKTQYQREPHLLIINDSYGALSCALAQFQQTQINDSVLAELGTLHNRSQNNLALNNLQQKSSLEEYPDKPDIVLLKLPNNHSYLQYILQQLASTISPDSAVLASAKAKDINRNVLAMFSSTLGPTSASLTVKKCRLVRCQVQLPSLAVSQVQFPLRWPLENSAYTLVNHANVFSREKLDQGARFFLQHLPDIEDGQTIIDLGCGNGVLGLPLLSQAKAIQMLFCDESYMAVDSARQTIAENLPQHLLQCRFIADDCLSQQADKSADVVLCNPPFHQQHAVTSHIASQMFADAKRVLRQGGRLRIVANRHLGYQDLLKRLFGNCRHLSADAKFVILEVIKRS
ncbi:methyltransferase [Rheinheimera maricola]|uniref:Ribosomal RNA large subunit methyltransferase G n=1 Tax=Rheinheimera maricola TaxID=2793282 RepID=A0ABS7X6F2_9GAMM|nr:methyltransferase [Rheinheimera maricola]MBZ9611123.1 methyltransferase [Rheinheimera maricola]